VNQADGGEQQVMWGSGPGTQHQQINKGSSLHFLSLHHTHSKTSSFVPLNLFVVGFTGCFSFV
jgi:hypothetical protein